MSAGPRRTPRRRCIERSDTDRAFDGLVPDDLRHLSEMHWTPIDIAIRVVKLLSPRRDERILDVGAGVGKLCSVGAMSSPAHWVGIEQHEPLVTTAKRLARSLGVADRTTFLLGDALSLDWDGFDVLYFYNPFELPLFPNRADAGAHELDYRERIVRVEDRLASLRAGTRIVTLHGFGGVMPPGFDLMHQERVRIAGLDLACWVQRAVARRRRVTS